MYALLCLASTADSSHDRGYPLNDPATLLQECKAPKASACKLDVPVFVLGLSNGKASRREDLKRAAAECGQDVFDVEAVDGRINDLSTDLTTVDPSQWNSAPAMRNSPLRSSTQISKSEFATTVSHLIAARTALEHLKASGEEHALIVEEDADFSAMPLWPQSLKQWIQNSNMQPDWHCVALGSTSYEDVEVGATRLSSVWHGLARLAVLHSSAAVPRVQMKQLAPDSRSMLWGAFAILYSRAGLEHLVSSLTATATPPRFALSSMGTESVADALIYETLNKGSWVAVPPLILHDDRRDAGLDDEKKGLGANWGATGQRAATENRQSEAFALEMMRLAWCNEHPWTSSINDDTVRPALAKAALEVLDGVARADARSRRLNVGDNSTWTGSDRRLCSHIHNPEDNTYHSQVWSNGTFDWNDPASWKANGLTCLGYSEGPCESNSDCMDGLTCGIDNCRNAATGEVLPGFEEGQGCCDRQADHHYGFTAPWRTTDDFGYNEPKLQAGQGDCNLAGCWPGLECQAAPEHHNMCNSLRWTGIPNATTAAANLVPGFLSGFSGELSESVFVGSPPGGWWPFDFFSSPPNVYSHNPQDPDNWSELARYHEDNLDWPRLTSINDMPGLVPPHFNYPMQRDNEALFNETSQEHDLNWEGIYGWGTNPEASVRTIPEGTEPSDYSHTTVSPEGTERIQVPPQFGKINFRDPRSWDPGENSAAAVDQGVVCCGVPEATRLYQLAQRCEFVFTKLRSIPSHQRMDVLPWIPRVHLFSATGERLPIIRIENAMGTTDQYLEWATTKSKWYQKQPGEPGYTPFGYNLENAKYGPFDSKSEIDALAEERGLNPDATTFYVDLTTTTEVASFELYTGYVANFDPNAWSVTCYKDPDGPSLRPLLNDTSFREWPTVFENTESDIACDPDADPCGGQRPCKLGGTFQSPGGGGGGCAAGQGSEAPSAPPAIATGSGDPHIVGAHGDKFDFKGEHNALYNMFSAHGFAVNARFVQDVYSLGDKEVHGSFITEAYVSVQLPGQDMVHIGYNATRPNVALLTVGRRQTVLSISPFNVNEMSIDMYELDGLRVELSKSHMHDATLLVKNGLWQATFKAHLYPFSTDNHEKKRLDLSFSQLDKNAAAKVAPHGLVGQTFDGDKIAVDGAQDDYSGKVVVTKAMGEGAIEGTASDYTVKSPYSTEFVYSRFSAEAAIPRDVSTLAGLKKKANNIGLVATTMNDNPDPVHA